MPRVLPEFSLYKRPSLPGQDDWLPTDAMVLCVLDIRVEDGELGSVTGLVHVKEGSNLFWVVSSSNMTYIPFVVIGTRYVKARKDGRYGLDDRTQHPQYFVDGFQWMSCIPRSVEGRPYLRWTPTEDDCTLISDRRSLLVLKPSILHELYTYSDHYSEEVVMYFALHARHAHLATISAHMVQTLTRLKTVPMIMKHIVFHTAEFQAACLDIHAWIDFKEAKQHSYERQRNPTLLPAPVKTNRMGAFTESVEVAQQLEEIGIPCWLLRPSDCIITEGDEHFRTNIHAFAKPNPIQVIMDDFMDGDRHDPFPIIWTGGPCTSMYQTMQRLASRVVDLRVPSAIGANAFAASQKTSLEGGPDRRPPSTSAKKHSTPYTSNRHAAKSAPNHLPAITPSQLERFKEPEDDNVPPAIPAWTAALTFVNTKQERVRKDKQYRLGFSMPDPSIILKASNRMAAIIAWLLSRMSHLNSLFSEGDDTQDSPELTSTHWSTLIHKLSCNVENVRLNPTPQASTSKLGIPTNPRKWTPHFTSVLDAAMSANNVFWLDYSFQLGSSDELKTILTPTFTSAVIWELYETNFRFELLFMDRTLAPEQWPSGQDHASTIAYAQRDLQVRSVFAKEEDGSVAAGYTLSQIPTSNRGLASFDWQQRYDSLSALHSLIKGWKGCPQTLSNLAVPFSEQGTRNLEREALEFYCQSFFDYFGRAPICPRRLPPAIINGEPIIAPGASANSASLVLALAAGS